MRRTCLRAVNRLNINEANFSVSAFRCFGGTFELFEKNEYAPRSKYEYVTPPPDLNKSPHPSLSSGMVNGKPQKPRWKTLQCLKPAFYMSYWVKVIVKDTLGYFASAIDP